MEASLAACPACSAALPAGARFCPTCGRSLEDGAAAPRYFGTAGPFLVLGLALALLVLALVLLAAGRWVPALLFVAAVVLLVPVFLSAARRSPENKVTRFAVESADRARAEAGVLAEAVTTWSHAGRDVVRLRHEQFRLRRELDEKLRELGRSVLDAEGGSPELVTDVRALEERLEANEAELGRTLDGARARLRTERAAIAQTEVLPADQLHGGSVALAEQPEAEQPDSPSGNGRTNGQ